MPGYLPAHQDLDDHLPQSHLLKHSSAATMDVEAATNADLQQMAHTPMLKSSAPKVFPSKLMKFANYLLAFHGLHLLADGA
jgi:hypothetical protein